MNQDIAPFLHHLCDVSAVESLKMFRRPMDIVNKDELKGKSTFDPVTIADKAAEKAIRTEINKQFPEHGILGEEYGSKNTDAEYCWIIDPIDGTRAYICGLPLWGTLIALYRNGEPLAGVMNQPFTGERYICDGKESFLVHNGQTTSLEGTKKTHISDCLMLTTAPKLFSDEEQPCYDRVEQACRMTRYGTDCYGYALVASGHVDLVVESGLHVYDIAALIPLIERAGGKMTNWQGRSCAQGGQVLACGNAEIHEQAIELLNAN